jgi:uncharacterized protein (TIGR03437 family)
MQSSPALRALRVLLAGMSLAAPIWATGAQVQAPSYTTAGIVSAASYSAAALSPNTIASLFGTNLSFETASLNSHSLVGGELPTSMGGVTIYISGVAVGLYFVSPTQINFLVPSAFRPGDEPFVVARDGIAGPVVTVSLASAGPALFQDSGGNAIATHLDGSVITSASPATAGEWVVLYADGLGVTIPRALNYTPAPGAAPLADMADFSVLLDGTAVGAQQIYYAGLAPGFAGLYQVNLKLPDTVGTNPQIQLAAGSAISIPNIHLQVQ